MKLFFYTLVIAFSFFSCNDQQKNPQVSENGKEESATNQQAIIEKVKNHPITSSITAGQLIDSLAGNNGITSWQFFNPQEYQNDDNVLGVVGSTKSPMYGSNITFKIAYIYQISSGKIVYYAGFMNEEQINEIEFIVSLEQKKMLDF
ncbi:hypothetical protein [Roseimarinus sediminis]|uniref:hypothetical protein n=1 Tax=Roseimarinus sediminis TaxID=1610899 RepID=UPI003D245916